MTGGLLLDVINSSLGYGAGPRWAFALATLYFGLGAVLLRPVVEPQRLRLEPLAA
jgi:hypothetical protein